MQNHGQACMHINALTNTYMHLQTHTCTHTLQAHTHTHTCAIVTELYTCVHACVGTQTQISASLSCLQGHTHTHTHTHTFAVCLFLSHSSWYFLLSVNVHHCVIWTFCFESACLLLHCCAQAGDKNVVASLCAFRVEYCDVLIDRSNCRVVGSPEPLMECVWTVLLFHFFITFPCRALLCLNMVSGLKVKCSLYWSAQQQYTTQSKKTNH